MPAVTPTVHPLEPGAQLMSHREGQLDVVTNFSFLGYWVHNKGSPRHAKGTIEVVAAEDNPYLALLRRFYHRVESTSGETERNVSPLVLHC